VAEVSTATDTVPAKATAEQAEKRPRPLQIVKIDLETNKVVLDEAELGLLEESLRASGLEQVAVVGVMGAFRTGKSFLLDLMLRYLREDAASSVEDQECVLPEWTVSREAPGWAVKCGDTMLEGREGRAPEDLSGFTWRPGMEKCTEGVWVWSEVFKRKAGEEDIAVVLMDTQGAWDARMTQEQSATVFGLTTLLTSRLVYNVSRQIQQDKIDNLLYFTEFAQAALRTNNMTTQSPDASSKSDGLFQPFQTLEFLVRDWPHYPEGVTVASARKMMEEHLEQYTDKNLASDTRSIDTLQSMFKGLDIWCLPHPSLRIERESWDGELAVVEPAFWRFLSAYVEKVFSPEELRAKTNLGTPVTVDTFGTLVREFIYAFRDAAPQAKTFAEAMESSSTLLARDCAMKLYKRTMLKESTEKQQALAPERFEQLAAETASKVAEEFESKAIFGTEEGISKQREQLQMAIAEEQARFRAENERKLENALGGLVNISLAAIAAFVLDRASDVTCDWWLGACQELSTDLFYGYVGVAAYIAYSVNNISSAQGELEATVATLELTKSMAKRAKALWTEFTDGKK